MCDRALVEAKICVARHVCGLCGTIPAVSSVPRSRSYDQGLAPPSRATEEIAPMSILLADDDLPCVKFISYILEDAGYRVLKAYDGADVLRSIGRHQPDLVLLDVQLPTANGFDIC